MAVVKEDQWEIYLKTGGYICRPRPDYPSEYKPGDKIKAFHFGGSSIIGVGKLPGRSKYNEYWRTAGSSHDYSKEKHIQPKYDRYSECFYES